MSYDHVAMLPFLINPSLLTPDEAAERAKDPIAWASKRYNQPESIFRKAVTERHGLNPSNPVLSLSPNTYSEPPPASWFQAPTHRTLIEPGPSNNSIAQPHQKQTAAPSQAQPLPRMSASPRLTGLSDPQGSSTPTSYFSTILSSEEPPEEMDLVSPLPSPEHRDGGQSPTAPPPVALSSRSIANGTERSLKRKKGKMPMRS
ncbi:hypothetical protein EJ07DRAFT_184864 [Lizonia empirigonia]|nr:hypothetical protein EJ07DRAFT_184864 [Lizonia empirigonia]